MNTKRSAPAMVRIPPDLVDEIDAAAQQEDRSRTKQVQHLLRSALARSVRQRLTRPAQSMP